ncbi:MAG: N-acetylmuramoyl-L-alanine amidase [Muribaculaceae bacterium]|nr:N-acetylmuramoyl-L-alanine amidase [Muribaculaceae bacterium]
MSSATSQPQARLINLIVVHCSATEQGRDFCAADIDRWHRERGFARIGYHYVIRLDGTIEQGRPESAVGAHCQGYNCNSIGICYTGGLCRGVPADTLTEPQLASLRRLIADLKRRYRGARVVGHRDLNPHKACPCFDVAARL